MEQPHLRYDPALPDHPYCVVDVETTGLSPVDRVVEVAAVHFQGGRALGHLVHRIDPCMPIPPSASAIHHLVDADVAGAPAIEEIAANLRNFIGSAPIVAHNADFDLGFLPVLNERTWLDNLRLARHTWPTAPSHKNQVLRYWLGIESPQLQGVGAHSAFGDAMVTGLLFRRALEIFDAANPFADFDDIVRYIVSPIAVEIFDYGKKHRGKRIADIPSGYLAWVVEDAQAPDGIRRMSVDSDTLHAVREVLSQRPDRAA